MSTKHTMAFDPNEHTFHLYQDYFDEGKVFLEIRKPCGCEETITIPAHIWEAIRHVPTCKFENASLSDEDIKTIVEERVDKSIAEYNNASSPKEKYFTNICGFGDGASSPREDQIKAGIEYYNKKRQEEKDILDKSKKFNVYMPDE